ncbi:homoserine dehydrogenase [Alkalihalobacillus alcalophilus ATCC 27647 = CGMCC 1.3604]|uniref:Homoserine dehydrogenase n=1 Tax=Alkalihalobacillus alcalophilus ATCC 27647 = CGMCC 1.3604 TaxID=1218173 RepID=A0A4S4JZU5_ALKAL|nr:homoserine dehydrogenase [Alkalihalobacillus alcalophilus]MED1562416.1 homoserine dehydrogenase [Alkalihalobacillus alcalophilus]THG90846.1 homoserine dehydrogenase [Alkalihalobacillus alcalophilus ATCC 27647 = CGMCC 1.3604]
MKIGLIGFGTVGKGVADRIEATKEQLQVKFGQRLTIEGILIKNKNQYVENEHASVITNDWTEFCQKCDYDIIFEAIGGLEPAFSYTEYFLEKGTPVITANKQLVAEYGELLEDIATRNQTYYGYEAAVAGGIPIINVIKGLLTTTPVTKVTGILNGTTNYILTEMKEKGLSFAEALKAAQELGYAESDPTDDIEGYDASYKIRILAKCCFGFWINRENVTRRGLDGIKDWQIELAERLGLTLKIVGEATLFADDIKAEVAPVFFTKEEAFSRISGVTNAVKLQGPAIGELTFTGPGAGKEATANSMVEDFLFHTDFKGHRGGLNSFPLSDDRKDRPSIVFNSEPATLSIEELLHPEAKVIYKEISPDGETFIVTGQPDIKHNQVQVIKIEGLTENIQVNHSLEFSRLTS